MKKYIVYAGGGKGLKILETDELSEAVSTAYAECGWVIDEQGNEVEILTEDGEPLFPEYVPDDEDCED